MFKFTKILFIFMGLSLAIQSAQADNLRERIRQRFEALKQANENTTIIRDASYGSDPLQSMDIYAPKNAKNAPVIFMVHGGAWRFGDKTSKDVVKNKVAYWLPKGLVFISANYRMLPNASVQTQADDVTQALIFAQKHASDWGGDARKFVLMGHSAGGHLVSLVSANPSKAIAQGAKPWLGTVSLDSAALDVPEIMSRTHYDMYDDAFGKDTNIWKILSPIQQLSAQAPPYLLICSTRRELDSCENAQHFADKAKSLKVKATVLSQDLSHMDINENVGLDGDYTKQIDSFIKNLLPAN